MKRTLIDAATGEIIKKKARFYMVYARHNYCLDKRLSLTDIRVLSCLASVMMRTGHVIDSQALIAKRVGIAVTHLSRSIKHLKECEYILVSQYRGKKCIRVNPYFISMREQEAWENEQLCAEEQEPYDTH